MCIFVKEKPIARASAKSIMNIIKLEKRQQWLCVVDGHSYVRTEIEWNDGRPITVTWHLNEDGTADYEQLTDEQLENLFWENNVKPYNPDLSTEEVMYRIKCSNGKYVKTTRYGTWITYSKNGKVFHSENLAKKNLYLCQDFAESSPNPEYNTLTYELEKIV